MSIASEITRLQGAKASIKSAIENKGVNVPSNALIDDFATYIAQISGGGSVGLEYETGTYEPTENINRPTISFSNAHNLPPTIVLMYDTTNTVVSENYTAISFAFIDLYRFLGVGLKINASTTYYAFRCGHYKSTGSPLTEYTNMTHNSDETPSGTSGYTRFWVKNTGFNASAGNSCFWRVGRTYKWIAIWK